MARSSSGGSGRSGNGKTSGVTWTSGWQRLSETFLRPPKKEVQAEIAAEPEDYSRLTDDEKRARIVTIDPLERKLGMAAAAFAAVLALLFNVPYMISKIAVATPTKPVGHACPNGLTYTTHGSGAATCNGVYPASHYILPLVVSLLLALAIFVTVRIGRRSALAFTTALTGVSFGSILYLVPFVGLAGWMLLRGHRTQKYGAPNAKSPRPGYVPPVGRATGRRAASGTAANGRSRRGTDANSAARKPPQASKRYTPKAPPKTTKKR